MSNSNIEALDLRIAKAKATLFKHSLVLGFSNSSLLSVPASITYQIYRKSLSPTLFLKNLSLTSLVLGPSLSGIVYLSFGAGSILASAKEVEEKGSIVRRSDYSIIGSCLGGLGMTTLLMRRVNIAWCLMGGVTIGNAVGTVIAFQKNREI